MERYSQYRDKGSGIAPFLPVHPEPAGLYLPFYIFLFIIRLPILAAVTLSYFLIFCWLPIGSLGRKFALWLILGVPGIWWLDLQIDGVKKGTLSKQTAHLPRAGSILVSNSTSPLDALYLAAIFDPIFTTSYPSSRFITRTSLLRAVCAPLSPATLNLTPAKDAPLITLDSLATRHPNRIIVLLPECTPTNGRAILPLSPSLLTAPSSAPVFATSLRYTPADITTPIPGWYAGWRFLWNLCSRPTHTIRVRLAQPFRNVTPGSEADEGQSEESMAAEEKGVLEWVGEALARLGRVKRVALGVKEKSDFVRAWKRKRR